MMDVSPLQVTWKIGGFLLAIIGLFNLITIRKHKSQDYKWKRIQKSEILIDSIYKNKYAHNALRLTDSSLTKIELLEEFSIDKKMVDVTKEDIVLALTTDIGEDENVELATTICHCFDLLFYEFNRIEIYIEEELINFEDIKLPFMYYISFLESDKKLYKDYAKKISYDGAIKLMNRFGIW